LHLTKPVHMPLQVLPQLNLTQSAGRVLVPSRQDQLKELHLHLTKPAYLPLQALPQIPLRQSAGRALVSRRQGQLEEHRNERQQLRDVG